MRSNVYRLLIVANNINTLPVLLDNIRSIPMVLYDHIWLHFYFYGIIITTILIITKNSNNYFRKNKRFTVIRLNIHKLIQLIFVLCFNENCVWILTKIKDISIVIFEKYKQYLLIFREYFLDNFQYL